MISVLSLVGFITLGQVCGPNGCSPSSVFTSPRTSQVSASVCGPLGCVTTQASTTRYTGGYGVQVGVGVHSSPLPRWVPRPNFSFSVQGGRIPPHYQTLQGTPYGYSGFNGYPGFGNCRNGSCR